MDLGKNILMYRTEAGLTQAEVAEKLHVSPQSVSQWEHNESTPDVYKIVDLAKILNTTVGHLLDENRIPQETKRHKIFNEERMYTYAKAVAKERRL